MVKKLYSIMTSEELEKQITSELLNVSKHLDENFGFELSKITFDSVVNTNTIVVVKNDETEGNHLHVNIEKDDSINVTIH